MKKPDWLLTNTLASGPLTIKKTVREMGWDIPNPPPKSE